MKFKVPLIIFALFLVVACSQTKRLRMGVEDFQNTDWALEEIDGNPVIDRVQSTIRFQANERIVGWGGCNRYFANFRSGYKSFEVGPEFLINLPDDLSPPVVMAQEERFFTALQKSRSIRMEGAYLLIDSEATAMPLKFGRLKKP